MFKLLKESMKDIKKVHDPSRNHLFNSFVHGVIFTFEKALTESEEELDRYEARCRLSSSIIPEAMALIAYASTVATYGNATKMITKTTHESFGVPTKEANAKALRGSKFITNLVKDQKMPESEELDFETDTYFNKYKPIVASAILYPKLTPRNNTINVCIVIGTG